MRGWSELGSLCWLVLHLRIRIDAGFVSLISSLLQHLGTANADIDVPCLAVEVLLVFVGDVVVGGGEAVAEGRMAVYLYALRHHYLTAIAHLSILMSSSVGLVRQWARVANDRELAVLIPPDQICLNHSTDFAQIKSARGAMVKVLIFVE